MKYHKSIVLLLVGFLFVSSCRKHDSGSTILQQDYPIVVGNKWIYQVTNNNFNITDIETVQIVSQTVYRSDSVVYQYQTSSANGVIDLGQIIKGPNSFGYTFSNNVGAYFTTSIYLFLLLPIKYGTGKIPQMCYKLIQLEL